MIDPAPKEKTLSSDNRNEQSMTETANPPDRPGNRILRRSVFPAFVIGSILLVLSNPMWRIGYMVAEGMEMGPGLGIAGICLIITGACMSFISGARDWKWIFHKLSSGSVLVLCVAVMSIENIIQQDTRYPIEDELCCLPMFVIAMILFVATILSARKKRPLLEFFILASLIIGFIFVISQFKFLPSVLNGTNEIPYYYDEYHVEPFLPWALSYALLYCGLFITTMDAYVHDYIKMIDEKLDAREREYFNARMKEKQLKR